MVLRAAWFGTVVTNAAIVASGIATGILTARLLGPEDRGLLAAVFFWPQTIAALATLSLGEALIARWSRNPVGSERLVASACLAALAIALAAIVPGALLLPLVLGPERSQAVALAQSYLAAYLPMASLATVLLARDQAEQRFARLNLLRLGPSWIYLVGIAILWAADAIGVATLLWATWLGSALTVAIRVCLAGRALFARPSAAELCALLSLGARFHAGAVLALLTSQIDRMLLFRLFDDATAGHYVVAATFASSGLAVVTSAVTFVLQPALANEPDAGRARALLMVGLRRTTLFLYVGVAASIAVTPWLLPFLFGRAFADSVPLAVLLLLAVIPLTLRQTIVRCLRAFGEARVGVTSELATLAGFFLACPVLLALGFGAAGLAAATIVSHAAGVAVAGLHLRARHTIRIRDWLVPGRIMISDGIRIAVRLLAPVFAR